MRWVADLFAALRGDDFPGAVVALLTLAALAVALWAALVALLALTPGLRGLAVTLTPRLLRGVALAGIAGALGLPSAHAEDRGVDGLRLPDRPLVADASGVAPVVVRGGDTVWAIAKAHLGPGAGIRATARASDRWYQANREVIGPDPDLIHPGQRLNPPSEDRP